VRQRILMSHLYIHHAPKCGSETGASKWCCFHKVVLSGVRVTAVVVTAVVRIVTEARTSLCILGDDDFRSGLVLSQPLEPLLARPGLMAPGPADQDEPVTDQDHGRGRGRGETVTARAENARTAEVVAEATKANPAAPTGAKGVAQTDRIIGGVLLTQQLR
jgi:hypothetical protein